MVGLWDTLTNISLAVLLEWLALLSGTLTTDFDKTFPSS